jgi:hypothetical protein
LMGRKRRLRLPRAVASRRGLICGRSIPLWWRLAKPTSGLNGTNASLIDLIGRFLISFLLPKLLIGSACVVACDRRLSLNGLLVPDLHFAIHCLQGYSVIHETYLASISGSMLEPIEGPYSAALPSYSAFIWRTDPR